MNIGQYGSIASDESHSLNIEPLIINIPTINLEICQSTDTNNCKNLFENILKCQQIILNDFGYTSQQYKENIGVHRQILTKYQSTCEDTQNDYFFDDLFDFKRN